MNNIFLDIESNNFDRALIDDWIAENVINNLFILQQKHFEDCSKAANAIN